MLMGHNIFKTFFLLFICKYHILNEGNLLEGCYSLVDLFNFGLTTSASGYWDVCSTSSVGLLLLSSLAPLWSSLNTGREIEVGIIGISGDD